MCPGTIWKSGIDFHWRAEWGNMRNKIWKHCKNKIGRLKRTLCGRLVDNFNVTKNTIEIHGKEISVNHEVLSCIMGLKDENLDLVLEGERSDMQGLCEIFH